MSVLDQVRKLEQQVVDRLKELEPLTREYEQLRKVAERLGVKYSPGSAEDDGEAKPAKSSDRARSRAGAGNRAARTPAKKPQRRAAARGSAAKPTATSRGTRSTSGQRAASRAEAKGARGKAAPRRAGKRAGSAGQPSGGRRAAPARPGQRDDELLRLVGDNPGITVRRLGERLGVDATGLYRVANRLMEAWACTQDGPRLYSADSAARPLAGTGRRRRVPAACEWFRPKRPNRAQPPRPGRRQRPPTAAAPAPAREGSIANTQRNARSAHVDPKDCDRTWRGRARGASVWDLQAGYQ